MVRTLIYHDLQYIIRWSKYSAKWIRNKLWPFCDGVNCANKSPYHGKPVEICFFITMLENSQ